MREHTGSSPVGRTRVNSIENSMGFFSTKHHLSRECCAKLLLKLNYSGTMLISM
ncbi:MAG: hypothetical protein GX389_04930 [Clostridiaceae bacterium]|nr:hypothetical protein [Clostridiaceae bacterium]